MVILFYYIHYTYMAVNYAKGCTYLWNFSLIIILAGFHRKIWMCIFACRCFPNFAHHCYANYSVCLFLKNYIKKFIGIIIKKIYTVVCIEYYRIIQRSWYRSFFKVIIVRHWKWMMTLLIDSWCNWLSRD